MFISKPEHLKVADRPEALWSAVYSPASPPRRFESEL